MVITETRCEQTLHTGLITRRYMVQVHMSLSGTVALKVEQPACNGKAEGSIPSGSIWGLWCIGCIPGCDPGGQSSTLCLPIKLTIYASYTLR